MGVPEQIIASCRKLYANPRFKVRVGGVDSDFFTRRTDIRQGCPLSPYLFVIVMTCLFEDVHESLRNHNMDQHHAGSATFAELLYADDTIGMTTSASSMSRLLEAIENVVGQYGLSLNKDKCDPMIFNSNTRVKFADNTLVPMKSEARYLGCWLNNKGGTTRELRIRLTQTLPIWQKLKLYVLQADDT